MLGHARSWLGDVRAIWADLTRLEAEAKEPVKASITYYGRLGEMGHEDDRADDWPSADTGQ